MQRISSHMLDNIVLENLIFIIDDRKIIRFAGDYPQDYLNDDLNHLQQLEDRKNHRLNH